MFLLFSHLKRPVARTSRPYDNMAYYLCPHCAKSMHQTVVHKDGTVHHTLVCRENGQEAYIGYRWEGCPYKRKEE